MDGEPTFPAGSRRARVVLLVVGAVVLAAAAVGVRAALGGAGGHDRPPAAAAGVAAAGTTVAGQAIGATVAGGGSGGPAATGAGTGTVRYQWGRGADDVRSEVKTYDIPVRYAFVTVHVKLDDTIKGNAASPTASTSWTRPTSTASRSSPR